MSNNIKMAVSMSNLPPELIYLLPSLLDKHDVSSLSRSCKRFRDMTLRYVYHTIRWQWDTRTRAPPIRLLLRTLMKKPKLGHFVEHIDFRCYNNDSSSQLLTDSEVQIAQQRVRHLRLPTPELWDGPIHNSDSNACIALILSFLPQLRTLLLSGTLIEETRFLGSLFTMATNAPSTSSSSHPGRLSQSLSDSDALHFSHLRHLYLAPTSDESSTLRKRSCLEELLSVFDLSHLAAATIDLPSPLSRFSFPSHTPSLEALTDLRLPFSESPPHVLETLLRASPPLKNLVFIYSPPDEDGEDSAQRVDMVSLSRAIVHVAKTLETLQLGVDLDPRIGEFGLPEYSDGPFRGSLRNLEQCERLKELRVGVMMLVGWHAEGGMQLGGKFPRSLRRLRLGDEGLSWEGCGFTVNRWLKEVKVVVGEKSEGRMNELEILEVESGESGGMWRKEEVSKMIEICGTGGVKGIVDDKVTDPWVESLESWRKSASCSISDVSLRGS